MLYLPVDRTSCEELPRLPLHLSTLQEKSHYNQAVCHNRFGTSQHKAPPGVMGNQALITSTMEENPKDEGGAAVKASANSTRWTTDQQAVFMTASIHVKRPASDVIVLCRLVLDTASCRTFITKALAEKLNFYLDKSQTLSISTFGSSKPETVKTALAKVEIFQKYGSLKGITVNILPKLTSDIYREQLPWTDLDFLCKFPPNKLADSIPRKSNSFCPDMLIGIDHFWELLLSDEGIKFPSNLWLVPSTLGCCSSRLVTSVSPWSNQSFLVHLLYIGISELQVGTATISQTSDGKDLVINCTNSGSQS